MAMVTLTLLLVLLGMTMGKKMRVPPGSTMDLIRARTALPTISTKVTMRMQDLVTRSPRQVTLMAMATPTSLLEHPSTTVESQARAEFGSGTAPVPG
jgi:hypothetical protein